MKVQDSIGAPAVGVSFEKVLSPLSAWCKTQGIKTDAQFAARINAMTDAQIVGLVRTILKLTIDVVQND